LGEYFSFFSSSYRLNSICFSTDFFVLFLDISFFPLQIKNVANFQEVLMVRLYSELTICCFPLAWFFFFPWLL
jgi:hypothetical protein